MKIGYSFDSLATFVEDLDKTVVKLPGDQTIAGTKTFSAIPLTSVAQGTTANQLVRYDTLTRYALLTGATFTGNVTSTAFLISSAQNTSVNAATRKDYVDGLLANTVKLTGDQTVVGVKTFSSNPLSSAAQSTSASALVRYDYMNTELGKKLDLSGGTMTGVINSTSNNASPILLNRGTQVGIGYKVSATLTKFLGFDIDGLLRIHTTNDLSQGGYVYTTENKPTTGDIGAVAKAGDTMTGGLNFTKNQTGPDALAQIMHNPAGTPGTASYLRSMREHMHAEWVWERIANGVLSYSAGTTGGGTSRISLDVSGGQISVSGTAPTNAGHLTRKDYVDGNFVGMAGDQTVAGVKTFSSNPLSSAAQNTAATALVRYDTLTTQIATRAPAGFGLGTGALDNADFDAVSGANQFISAGTSTKGAFGTHSPALIMHRAGGFDGSGAQTQIQAVGNLLGFRTRAYNVWTEWISVYSKFNKPTAGDLNAYTKTETDTLLNAKANLAGATFTGTVTGAKFLLSTAQGTEVNALTRKDYVDGLIATRVNLTGAQTITGVKTFSEIPLSPQMPALFANNTQLASTEFVQRALGNHQNVQLLTSSSSMAAAAFGKVFWAGGSSTYDINLPLLSVSPAQGGGVVEIFCTNPAGVIIKAVGTDNILTTSTGVKQISLGMGKSLKFVSSLANGVYLAY